MSELPLIEIRWSGVVTDSHGELALMEAVPVKGLFAEQASFALYGRKKKDVSVFQVTLTRQPFGWQVEWSREDGTLRQRIQIWERTSYVEIV